MTSMAKSTMNYGVALTLFNLTLIEPLKHPPDGQNKESEAHRSHQATCSPSPSYFDSVTQLRTPIC